MLIAGLIALLSMMLGETHMPFLLPNEEKSIDKIIKDKVKRKQLTFIAEGIEEKESQYKKDKKKYTEKLEKLNLNRNATSAEFRVATDQIHRINKEAFSYMVKVRLSIDEFLTDQEWNAIITDGKKRYHKTKTKYEKAYPDFEKAINKLIVQIDNTIEDKEKSRLITKRIRMFSTLTLQNSKKISSYNIYDHPVLSDINSTEKELKLLGEEILKLRGEVVKEYILIHNLIVENTTEEEWPKIMKKINKLF